MFRFFIESSMLAGARMVWGDEAVGDVVFEQEYDAGFVDRHLAQLSSLFETKFIAEYDADD